MNTVNNADISFRAMGCEIRLIVAGPAPGASPPAVVVEECRRFVHDFDARLSRFRPDSELCALNADRRSEVPASSLLRDAVRSGIQAAQASGGLVDPTLLEKLEAAGYQRSLEGVEPASLREALLLAPTRGPAHPDPRARWREIEVDEAFGIIRRPPRLRFDTGGTGKGLAADLLAERLRGYASFVVDCGGDMRVGGHAVHEMPVEVHVEHPLTKEHGHVIALDGGAVATSGIDVRVWRRADGRYAHHLLDPSTGEPAWTGLIGATAIAPTALEAETLSKSALLLGPVGARELLRESGGLIVHDDGETEAVGRMQARPRYSITVPASALGQRVAA
jgi:thiamine biosynthesis lipoprotein